MKKIDILKNLVFFNILSITFFLIFENHTFKIFLCSLSFIIDVFLFLYFLKTGNGEEIIDNQEKEIRIHVSLYLITAATLVYSLSYIVLKFSSQIANAAILFFWFFELFRLIRFGGAKILYPSFYSKKNELVAILGDGKSLKQVTPLISKKRNISFVKNIEDLHFRNNNSNITDFFDNEKNIGNNKVKEIFITSSAYQHSNNNIDFEQLTHDAAAKSIKLRIIGTDEDLQDRYKHLHKVEGIPVLAYYKEPLAKSHNKLIKRSFDILVSGFVIVFILSWFIPLVAIFVKLESKGPVFFRQLRSGKDNKPFWCIKFRSMTPNKESDQKQAVKGDQRITKVGAFLRKTSLDEFPQFVNVFLGDMSITGPRPHMLKHTEEFSEVINEYMVRLYAKPGITGWAQVNGYRGETSQLYQMKKRVEFDIWYIENWNFFLDIKIIVRTFLFLFKKNAEVF